MVNQNVLEKSVCVFLEKNIKEVCDMEHIFIYCREHFVDWESINANILV